jgi:hypothetical protein
MSNNNIQVVDALVLCLKLFKNNQKVLKYGLEAIDKLLRIEKINFQPKLPTHSKDIFTRFESCGLE